MIASTGVAPDPFHALLPGRITVRHRITRGEARLNFVILSRRIQQGIWITQDV